jgi:hypothetical protein
MTDDLVQRLRRTYRKEYAPTVDPTVADISNRLRPFPILAAEVLFNPDGKAAADRIEAQAAEIERLREALHDCADDLESEIEARRGTVLERTTERDLGSVRKARAALAKAGGRP